MAVPIPPASSTPYKKGTEGRPGAARRHRRRKRGGRSRALPPGEGLFPPHSWAGPEAVFAAPGSSFPLLLLAGMAVAAGPAPPKETATDLVTGLSTEEARRRLAKIGPNEVPERREHAALQFLRRFWGPTPWMLELTAVLTWVLDRAVETVIVLALLVFNGVLAFLQERRADSALEFLRDRLHVDARVLRNGAWGAIPARDLVPGDVVRLRAGDLVPADVRVASGVLDVDQSALTGESLTVEKGARDTVASGSTVTRGEATGVVTATGLRTMYGRTVELVQIARPKLHMEAVISSVVKWLLVMVGLLLAAGIAATALQGKPLIDVLPLAVILLVSAVPVALPTMFAISMALGSLELAKNGVLVTRLAAGEDAAAMDVLCADKTGTITMNRLSVVAAIPVGGHTKEDVLRTGALASVEANRDPIDVAVLAGAHEAGVALDGYETERFIPFDPSTRRTEAVVSKGGDRLLVAKGAVGAILDMGKAGGQEVSDLLSEVERLSRSGYRTIAVAAGPPGGGASVVGLIALSDRPRPDSAQLIRELGDLGVSVKMLTGDALPVAMEVASNIGLGEPIVRMSSVKGRPGEPAGFEAVEAAKGLAEIYPEDKYLIVKGLQEHGHVVGMTGDGVNDAPALRQAETGIAVKAATDVAKRSASVVLTSEGLGGIVDLVKTGRRIYQRIVTWILNKVVKTFQIVVFVVAAYLLTGQYVVSVFSMILFLFVTDFVTLSLSTDTVSFSRRPDTWDVRGLVRAGALLGVAVVVESLLFLYAGTALFGLQASPDRLQTFVFAYLVFLGVLGVLILRERGHFWESRPSRTLGLFVAVDVVVVSLLATLGVPELSPISGVAVLFALLYAAVTTFVVNDPVKVALLRGSREGV